MFIVHKKGLKLDGNNPTLLYGYGGFNISCSPSFSTSRLILLENGGVFALVNLRVVVSTVRNGMRRAVYSISKMCLMIALGLLNI